MKKFQTYIEHLGNKCDISKDQWRLPQHRITQWGISLDARDHGTKKKDCLQQEKWLEDFMELIV